ncbi:MAG: phosphotransferase [Acidobacteria bacterium]|nr:phosphotransferase [Acidobacteriota bacterium]
MNVSGNTIDTATLRSILETGLTRHFGSGRRISGLARSPSAYCTSHAIEELNVQFEDGTALQVLFKDLSRRSMLPEARRTRPDFLHEPLREIEVYLDLLEPGRLDTAACYGVIAEPETGRFGLLLEKVPGVELYQVGPFAVWQEVARWLARMHAHFSAGAEMLASTRHLLRYDRRFYQRWLHRAQAFLARSEPGERGRACIERLAPTYHRVIERLLALPVTFIHGEFYPSNILVQERTAGLRVCPVDWEMSAAGPGLVDLAAFTAGKWTGEEKEALALAYRDMLAREGGRPPEPEAFLQALDYCRLHLALQWLGWASDWRPPREHSHDWPKEVADLMERLAL